MLEYKLNILITINLLVKKLKLISLFINQQANLASET